MVYRKSEIERITDVAIATARGRRKHITLVDKANVLETSVLWRKVVSERIKTTAPDITLATMYIDNAAMQLVLRPAQFDVVLTENMFGDILSDEMAVICGSLGMMASASLGMDINRHGKGYGLYEPSGGTAPDIAGQDKANPCAQVLSVALMLRHSFGLEAEAKAIENAVEKTIADGIRTADIAGGGKAEHECAKQTRKDASSAEIRVTTYDVTPRDGSVAPEASGPKARHGPGASAPGPSRFPCACCRRTRRY
jgi:3-isopropylmalate dehydrogenase